MLRLRPHHLLAALPTLGILVGVPIANRLPDLVFGLPVLLVWIVGCVLATSAVMAIVAALDDRDAAARRDGRGEPRA